MHTPPRFLTDEKGKRIAVVLDIADYERLIEELEDMEDIRAADEAKASGEVAIPYEQARDEILRSRR